jgi:hypothetical protein
MDVSAHCCRNAGRAQGMGKPLKKRNYLFGQQTRPEQDKALRLTALSLAKFLLSNS